jgi:hypothetical protein
VETAECTEALKALAIEGLVRRGLDMSEACEALGECSDDYTVDTRGRVAAIWTETVAVDDDGETLVERKRGR